MDGGRKNIIENNGSNDCMLYYDDHVIIRKNSVEIGSEVIRLENYQKICWHGSAFYIFGNTKYVISPNLKPYGLCANSKIKLCRDVVVINCGCMSDYGTIRIINGQFSIFHLSDEINKRVSSGDLVGLNRLKPAMIVRGISRNRSMGITDICMITEN